MTEQQLDAQGEARDALSSIVADFGPRVLSDPRMLGSRMSDLLPDSPKERQLLITAAEADVAGDLTRHVQEQHLDPNTAVQLVAGSLSDRKSIDLAASTWVAGEYAKALGYNVQPGAMPPPSRPFPPPQPPGQATVTTYGQQGPTLGASGGYGQPQPPPGGGGYGQPQPPPGVGGYQPLPPAGGQAGIPDWSKRPTRNGRDRGLMYGIGAAAAAVVIIVAVGFPTHWFGLTSSSSSTTPTPPPTTTHPPTTTAPPSPVSTVDPLVELLPGDIDDPASQCEPYQSPDWNTTGLVQSYTCIDPGLPGNNDDLAAFQFNSYASYQASWQAFNQVIAFNTAAKGSSCPPPSGDAAGTTQWKDHYFPYRDGQVLECGTISSSNQPEYIWSYPTENAYVFARGQAGMSLASLNTWWEDNAQPLNSPTPSP